MDTTWSGALLVIVSVSVVAFVVRVIPVPAAVVNVSLLESATIVGSPATAKFLKMFWAEPVSVFVTVILPLEVIGPPDTEMPVLAVRFTDVTVPTNWSADVTVKLG
jgi:hypothetical protein